MSRLDVASVPPEPNTPRDIPAKLSVINVGETEIVNSADYQSSGVPTEDESLVDPAPNNTTTALVLSTEDEPAPKGELEVAGASNLDAVSALTDATTAVSPEQDERKDEHDDEIHEAVAESAGTVVPIDDEPVASAAVPELVPEIKLGPVAEQSATTAAVTPERDDQAETEAMHAGEGEGDSDSESESESEDEDATQIEAASALHEQDEEESRDLDAVPSITIVAAAAVSPEEARTNKATRSTRQRWRVLT
jgi:hypothetical protein